MTSLVHLLYLHSFQILCYKEQLSIILEYIQTIQYIYILTLYFIWLLFFSLYTSLFAFATHREKKSLKIQRYFTSSIDQP
jgi:hypothetical protein